MAVHFSLKALTRAAQAQLTPVAPSHLTPTPISMHTPALSVVTSMATAGLVVLKLEEPRFASKAAGMVTKMQSQGTPLTAVVSRGVVYVVHYGLLLPRQLHLTGEPSFSLLAMKQVSLCCLPRLHTCLAKSVSMHVMKNGKVMRCSHPFWCPLNKHASFVDLH